VRRNTDSGASAVEFALVLPLLLMLVFGIVEWGLAFGRIHSMEAAAREGARLASLGRDVQEPEVVARARGAASVLIDPDELDVTVTPSGSAFCAAQGDLVTVEVRLSSTGRDKYAINIPMWGSSPATYEAKGVFQCEAPRN
jgi:hypothetical protein